jgi:cystathionine beta-synthase
MTVTSNSECNAAIETMRDNGFDQLPVLAPAGKRLVGLVTLGNILSYLTHGRANGKSPVSDVMFDFSKISEIVTEPRDIGKRSKANGAEGQTKEEDRSFIEITMNTPLSTLNRFFEWNSAAIVTEKAESGGMKPVAIVTKVDLLTWLLHQNKLNV